MKQQVIHEGQKMHTYFKERPGVFAEWQGATKHFHDLVHFLNTSKKPCTLGYFERDLEQMFLARLRLFQNSIQFLTIKNLKVNVYTHHEPVMFYVLQFRAPTVDETVYQVRVPWDIDLEKNPLPYEPVVLEGPPMEYKDCRPH